jgi:hypothetical protein
MTIRTFWTIFIKILGIWLVLSFLTVIQQFVTIIPFFQANGNDISFNMVAYIVSILIVTIGIYIFILRLFVFRTSWLIDKLHLEKGFEEEKIELNIQRSIVFTIATIVIGGIIFVDSLPHLCRLTIGFIKESNPIRESPNLVWFIFYLVKTIIGYLLMTNSQFVVSFINKQNVKPDETDE